MATIAIPTIMHDDYVTKKEFSERLDLVDEHIEDIEKRLNRLREELNSDYERHVGMIYEKSKHDLKMATEYLEFVIKSTITEELSKLKLSK